MNCYKKGQRPVDMIITGAQKAPPTKKEAPRGAEKAVLPHTFPPLQTIMFPGWLQEVRRKARQHTKHPRNPCDSGAVDKVQHSYDHYRMLRIMMQAKFKKHQAPTKSLMYWHPRVLDPTSARLNLTSSIHRVDHVSIAKV